MQGPVNAVGACNVREKFLNECKESLMASVAGRAPTAERRSLRLMR